MPKGFLPLLCERCGTANYSNMSQVVGLQNANSAYWPEVLKLARETDAVGYERWATANPDKLPAQPVTA